MGLILVSMFLMVYVEWEHVFDIYHIFLHMLPHPSSSWANNTLANGPYVPESVLLNDFHIPPRVTLLTHTGTLNDLGTEGRVL